MPEVTKDWKTLETPHFRIYHEAEMQTMRDSSRFYKLSIAALDGRRVQLLSESYERSNRWIHWAT